MSLDTFVINALVNSMLYKNILILIDEIQCVVNITFGQSELRQYYLLHPVPGSFGAHQRYYGVFIILWLCRFLFASH